MRGLRREVVELERREEADDSFGDALGRLDERVLLGHLRPGRDVEPTADVLHRTGLDEARECRSRDAGGGDVARPHDAAGAQACRRRRASGGDTFCLHVVRSTYVL